MLTNFSSSLFLRQNSSLASLASFLISLQSLFSINPNTKKIEALLNFIGRARSGGQKH